MAYAPSQQFGCHLPKVVREVTEAATTITRGLGGPEDRLVLVKPVEIAAVVGTGLLGVLGRLMLALSGIAFALPGNPTMGV